MPPFLHESTDDDEHVPDSQRPNVVFKQKKKTEPTGPIVKVFVAQGGQELHLEDENGSRTNLQKLIPVKGPFDIYALHELVYDIIAAAKETLGPDVNLNFVCARNQKGYTIHRVTNGLRTGEYDQFCRATNRMAKEVSQLDFEKVP